MIGRLTGVLLEKNPPLVLLDVQGVGYEVDVPMSTFYNLPGVGERVSLFTHMVVREDGQFLFGFLSDEERATFRQLLKISGIGARTALSVLSGLSAGELAQAVGMKEVGRLIKIPGIGKKTAERLLLELRDKLNPADLGHVASVAGAAPSGGSPGENKIRDAVLALTALGYKAADADKAVRQAWVTLGAGASTEALIKKALG